MINNNSNKRNNDYQLSHKYVCCYKTQTNTVKSHSNDKAILLKNNINDTVDNLVQI